MSATIDTLTNDFARAGVALQVAHHPFGRTARDDGVVQMEVHRWRDRGQPREAIRLCPGKEAHLGVTGVDREVRQLVLRVKEARATFQERVWDRAQRRFVWRTRTTTDSVRRFLVGEDECHLFVAQLTIPASTVAQAHETLRPRELSGIRKVRRQGEWFFLPMTFAEREIVRQELVCKRIHRDVGIGAHLSARGRPHVVSELLRVRSGDDRWIEFVRGHVRHSDHKTVHLREWVRVVMNTEERSVGATWVD